MRNGHLRAPVFFVLALASAYLGAATTELEAAEKAIRINLGTLAPRGSVYHQSLQAMAEA